MARASRVPRCMCGCTSTQRTVRRDRDLLHARMIDAHGEHQSAEQAGRDIVEVRGAARDDLALHGELQQLQARHRLLAAARWRRPRPPRRRRPNRPYRKPSGMPFSMSSSNPKFSAERRMHRLHGAAGRVVLRLDRQIVPADAADGADAHHRLIDATYAAPDRPPPRPYDRGYRSRCRRWRRWLGAKAVTSVSTDIPLR